MSTWVVMDTVIWCRRMLFTVREYRLRSDTELMRPAQEVNLRYDTGDYIRVVSEFYSTL